MSGCGNSKVLHVHPSAHLQSRHLYNYSSNVDIREAEKTITIRFYFELVWTDNRLTFLKLRNESIPNILPQHEAEQILRPEIDLPNLFQNMKDDGTC